MRVGFDKRPNQPNSLQCLISSERIDEVGYRRNDTVKSKVREVDECAMRKCGKVLKDHHTKLWQVGDNGNWPAAECVIVNV